MDVVLATQNKGKIKEFKTMFEKTDFEVKTLDLSVVEDCETFEGNAIKKALAAMRKSGCVSIADDSGLEVDALKGQPGVRSARFAGEHATDEQNNELLLKKMAGHKQRTARFICVIAVAFPNMDVLISRGECEGVILTEKKGTEGFGYDPVFYIPEKQMTFGELPIDEKNKISHRSKALNLTKKQIEEYFGRGESA